jgi:hypothetical protein
VSVSEWREYTVKELVDLKMLDKPLDGNHGGMHPKSSDYVTSGIPSCRGINLNLNALLFYPFFHFSTSPP